MAIAALTATTMLAWSLDAAGAYAVRGAPALVVYALTESGGSRLVPLILLAALLGWATDPVLPLARRRRQALVALSLLAATLPVAAVVNEFVIKPSIAAPRPSHRRLAAAGIIPAVDDFYRLERRQRSELVHAQLADATQADAVARLDVHPVVLRHWAHEVGSSFPSSHALNAFVAAVLFLGGALAEPTPRRRRIAKMLLVWAVAVALSRVLLLVHRPLDVSVGAAAGAVIGAGLLLPWQRWRRDQKST